MSDSVITWGRVKLFEIVEFGGIDALVIIVCALEVLCVIVCECKTDLLPRIIYTLYKYYFLQTISCPLASLFK